MDLVNFNGALCLESARYILTNKEKIKDRQVADGAVFIFRFSISLVPSMHLLQRRCDKPNFTLNTKLTFSFQSCQLYILDARRTLPVCFLLFAQKFSSLLWLLGKQCDWYCLSTVGDVGIILRDTRLDLKRLARVERWDSRNGEYKRTK
jgi:hypothetical protein